MNCSDCNSKKKMKEKTLKKHRYKECGLNNIILSKIKEFSCEDCGNIYCNYGGIEKLHQIIARYLIRKDTTLSGKELKFLRKYLGYSGVVFSKLIGYEVEHLSRLENGKAIVQEVFDRLVRSLIIEKMPNRDYCLQDLFLEGKLMKIEWLEFSLSSGKKWTLKKEA